MINNQQIIDLIQQLQNINCRIWVEDDKLRIRTSKNSLTPELKQEIQNHKNEIIAFLQTAKKQVVSTEEIPILAADTPQPLSFAQQRLWILSQLQGATNIYNMPVALQINGQLNIDALYASFKYLFNRHQSLRMYFPQINGEPQIAVHNLAEIQVLNIQYCPKFNHEDNNQIQNLINTHIQETFDLNQGQLFKATLLQFKNHKFVLVMNMHHIISDGWSMGVLMRELWQAYRAFNQGEKPNFSPLPIQYSDYAAWQRNRLQGEIFNKQINYWQEQLNNAPPLLELPTDFPRPPVQSFQGNRYIFSLSTELTNAIKTFSQQQNVSLFMTLLTTLNILLSRYSRQNDLCIGSPIANRTHSQTEGLIGFFVNTLVLRNQINWHQNFLDLLQQTRQTCLNAYAHQDIPFEVLVEKLKPERSITYNPLFQVMFALENNEHSQVNIPGLNIEMFGIKGEISKFDLSLLVMEENQQLTCYWEYATDLFTTTTIQNMAEHFHVLIQEIINYPQQPLYTLSLLTANGINQIKSWNQTQKAYPQNQTFVDLFTQQVEKNPDKLAVVFASKSLTYQQLNLKAEQLANYLILNYDIKADTLIGIAIERSLEMIIGVLGILKAGAAYVPID
ncbi:MAG: non-ribosomal peptide synthetase, partial [Nostocales cyanobacterium]